MEEINYSIETEEEFYEDFGRNYLSDEELNNVLIKARKNSDAELRFIVKELQYTRFLLKNIIEFVVDPNENNDLLTIQKLVKNYVNAMVKVNNKNL
jgi:hypothetical protein